ncbi:MAG: SurA N-terminal domain-containing protein [Rhodobacteraceae bacterium]|nr:SurA N-terminal domain-containing protein [Paracoccaceae bacterium]
MSKKPATQKWSAKNIAAAFLMALLGLSLLGFGVEGFGSRTTNVGSVGDRDITADEYARAMQNELRALQGQLGQNITMEQARMFGLDQQVLERLVTSAVLENEAARLGISAGDDTVRDEILQISAFQGLDGGFDREAYRFALQNAGMTERAFEDSIRDDVARSILQLSVIGGASAPEALVTPLVEFQAQTRDLSVTTLTSDDLPEPVGLPEDAELQAFYEEEIARYTRPEGKRIQYAWITPEMMLDTIEVDEQILRDAYEARAAEFRQPERRLVERLVYPDVATAQDAFDRWDAGEASFEDLVAERGLDLDDTDMGDVTEDRLGAAGEVVFAMSDPGVTGPVQTSLGPALFRMNAVLSAQEISFEDARDQLRDEQLADMARRALVDDIDLFDDLLAGGATVRELADETDMQFGEIDWRPDTRDGIAAYESFRDAARALEQGDFAELNEFEDGGLFALEYIESLPEAPRPLDDIRDEVIADWQDAQVRAALSDLAEQLQGGGDATGIRATAVRFEGITRNDTLPDLPGDVLSTAFDMDMGESRVVEDGARVHLVELHDIASPDPMREDVASLREQLDQQIAQGIAEDLFSYFAAILRDQTPIRLDQQVIGAVQENF